MPFLPPNQQRLSTEGTYDRASSHNGSTDHRRCNTQARLSTTLLIMSSSHLHHNITAVGGAFRVTWSLKIWGNKSGNISEMVQDRYIVTMEIMTSPIKWHQYQWTQVTLNATSAVQNIPNSHSPRNTHTHTRLRPFVQDYPGEPVPER